MVKINMKADKNFVKPGDTVNISGNIDNTQGKIDVNNLKIYFLQKKWGVSSTKLTINNVIGKHILYTLTNSVQVGKNDQFSCSVTIPKGFLYSTTIGATLSKYFALSIEGDMKECCGPITIAKCQVSILFHTDTPKI